jgi:uncharacterized protein (DUF2147 family)
MFVSARLSQAASIMLAALALSPTPAAAARDVTGVWVTDDGEGAVDIQPCGEQLCGRIVWLKDPVDSKGQPQRDSNNPNPAARQRLLCGAPILEGLKRQSDDSWDGGSIYDPEEGKTYKVTLKLDDQQRLQVTGYIGYKWLGETVVWTRGDAHLGRCEAAAKPRASR